MGPTIVADVMTPRVYTCRVSDTLDCAALLMWDHDCGAIPIVDRRGHVVGMVTDRDICMAAYTRGEPLRQIPVTVAGSRSVHSVPPDASLAWACEVMKRHRVRRLPVIDVGGNLAGMLSLADLVRDAQSSSEPGDSVQHIVSMLAEIGRRCPLPRARPRDVPAP